jgi:hypothetical protein
MSKREKVLTRCSNSVILLICLHRHRVREQNLSDTLPAWGATFHPDFVIVSALQMCMSRHRHFQATLKTFPLLNKLHVVWGLSFLYVSAWHSEFNVGFEGKQCTRILPSYPGKLWLWSLLICRIAFCYSFVYLLGHFKVTGPGPVPFDNLQELDKCFIYRASFSASLNPVKTNITMNYI